MTRIITTLTLFVSTLLIGQQTQFEKGMEKAFSIWKEGKNEEARAIFERIASAEKTQWLPNYYIALIHCTAVFESQDKEKNSLLIDKAQTAIDEAKAKAQNNSEIHVLQALIYTATLIQDPMTNGMKYSMLATQEYDKAISINPNNPRAVFGKAEFELGGAKWTGADTKPICEQIIKSIELFNNFKPESVFHPKWGLERAQQIVANCK